MKTFKFISLLVAATVASAVAADPVRLEVPSTVAPAQSTLTRAEVIADFLVWQAAGLQWLTNSNKTPDTSSIEYKAALARYEFLRSSPQFQALVQQVSTNPQARVSIVDR